MISSVGFNGRSIPIPGLRPINGGAGAITSRSFHCYQCNRTVRVLIRNGVDLACPLCYEAFLEKLDRTNFSPSPPLATAVGSVPLYDGISSASDSDFDYDIELSCPSPAPLPPPLPARNLTHNCAYIRRTARRLPTPPSLPPTSGSGSFRPLPLPPPPPSTEVTGTRVAPSSSRELIQPSYPLPPPPLPPPFSPPRSPSFRGYLFPYPDPIPIMELLKEKILVESFDRKMSQELMRSEEESPQCAVCLENLEVDETVKRMPCEHIFHSDCILRWLDSQRHRTCPLCRYELPWNCVTDL